MRRKKCLAVKVLGKHGVNEYTGECITCREKVASSHKERLAAEVAAALPGLMLAGGLTPDNVAAAVAHVRPFAVDVAGGVERAPGLKDPALVRAFIARAKAA